MKDKVSPRSGVLDCEQGSATFYEDDYDFRIMNSIPFKATSSNTEDFAKLAQEDKYFHGTTHDGNDIAIYCGNRIMPTIRTIANFHSNIYAVQKGNLGSCDWNKIDAIEFRGGTLNFLSFSQDSPYELVDNTIKPLPPKSPYTFSLMLSGSPILVQIGENLSGSYGKDRVELVARSQYLKLKFQTPISFGDIQFHIEKIKTLVSFMTFRQNIDFDEIVLQKRTLPPGFLMDTAVVYSKAVSFPTEKNEFRNICFDELSDAVPFLIELLYNEETNNTLSFMNFIPETDNGIGRITNDMVKGIVTCLECEILRTKKSKPDDKSADYTQEEMRLQSLVKELQKVAKEFQSKNGKFAKKTNDMICGTLKHMTLADADKISLFYTKYQGYIHKLFDRFEIIPTEDDIKNLIIYRNRITHGTQDVLDERLVMTALYLIGLIYCMILHSIGIDDKELEQLCSKHFLLR